MTRKSRRPTCSREYVAAACAALVRVPQALAPTRPRAEVQAAGTGCQLGDAYILHSTLLKDDERVLEAYETGVRFLQRAYERNPGTRRDRPAARERDVRLT